MSGACLALGRQELSHHIAELDVTNEYQGSSQFASTWTTAHKLPNVNFKDKNIFTSIRLVLKALFQP